MSSKVKNMRWRNELVRVLGAALLACVALGAPAQTLEEVAVVSAPAGAEAVTRITFTAPVRLLQQSPTTPAQVYQLRLEFTGLADAVLNQPVDETRRQPAAAGLPAFSLVVKAAPRQRVRLLQLQFNDTVGLRARPGPNSRSIDLVFSAGPGAPAAAPAVLVAQAASQPAAGASAPAGAASSAAASPEDAQALDLLNQARAALAARQNGEAADLLNRLLRLPPNVATQEAQELIGLAWERAGDTKRAQAEYELYLRLHPEGEGAERVAQRLAALTTPVAAGAPAEPAARRQDNRLSGNLAQYYFGGKARSQSLVTLPSGIDQSQLTRTTESALVTSLDLGGRYVTGDHDLRFVVRGSGATNLAKSSHNASSINALYVDYRRSDSGTALRVGRQAAISGGLLGLFDGLSLTTPLPKGLRLNVMGGVPANSLVSAPAERMAALMVEADNLGEHWGGNVYLVQQTVEGFVNRSGLGTEVRYADDVGSAYALLDYDTRFQVLNAVSVQGSVQGPGQTSYTVLVDARKAPSLQLSNALIAHSEYGTLTHAITSLGQTQASLLADARKVTADARQAMLSVSRPLTAQWQVTGDLRVSEVGKLPAVGDFEETQATGQQVGLTLQLTGSNLYSRRDINNFNLSVLSTPYVRGYQLAFNNLTGALGQDLTLEPSLRLYTQTTTQATTGIAAGDKLWRVSPGMRVSYRLSRKASVMGESLLEYTRSTAANGNRDSVNAVFFYLGYRYELF